MRTLLVEGEFGGETAKAGTIENYPGAPSIDGYQLMKTMREQALAVDTHYLEGWVTALKGEDACFTVEVDSKDKYYAKSILLAGGAERRHLDLPNEKELANKGVHYCALCDGAFYKGKVIGVVGSGDSAAKEALLLSTFGSKVYIFVRGDRLKPEPVNLERVKQNSKIEVIAKIQVKEIKGEKKVTHVVFDREFEGKKELALDALFVEIGHIALSELAKELGVALSEKGEIKIDRLSRTNMPGVFAAGDVADSEFKQAITGVAEGVNAAYSAYEYVNKNGGLVL